MRTLKWTIAIAAVLAATGLFNACHKNLTPATPGAAAAIKADDVVVRVNELQATVIDYCGPGPACAPGTIDTNLARQIVGGLIPLRNALVKAPDGWKATARQAWADVKPKFAGVKNPAIQSALAIVDALIGGL